MHIKTSCLQFGLAACFAIGLAAPLHAAPPPALLSEVYSQSNGMPRFPDFGYMIEPGTYTGRVFVLSQDYPRVEPQPDEAVKKILAIDFKKDWRAYLMAVRDYVFAGNTGHAGGYENDFFLEDNKVRHWYHVPWQHWGTTGREGYHGLTQEGPVSVQMLAPEQLETTHAYAVGFYNDLGGYTIGRVWADADRPDVSYMRGGRGFPVGTVVAKVLFVTFNEKEVPYLKNPISWNAYVYASDTPKAAADAGVTRVTAPVQLIQMDIMVRDPRAQSTGGWVFGNFIYNGALNKPNRWENLVPVGLEWGNDPTVTINLSNPTPTETKINPALKETIINPDKNELPPTHLGFGFRLNGPVDSTVSSCMSCHSTAEYPEVSAILPFLENPPINPPANQGEPASPAWMRWFRNVPCAVAFDPGQAMSFDYSLQLSKSIENFIDYKNATVLGQYAVEYWEKGHHVHRGTFVKPKTEPAAK
jgi:hypothetical protein